MWASLSSWLTPTSLFVVVNLVIATIAVTSRLGTHKSRHPQLPPHAAPQLTRVPSLLDRVKSFNFSPYNVETVYLQPPPSDDSSLDPTPPHLTRAPSVLDRLKSINLSSLCRSDSSIRETESPQLAENSPAEQNHDHLMNRSKSDSANHAPSLQRRLKKSLSEKLAWVSLTATTTPGAGEEDGNTIERRRPATSRTENAGTETPEGDDGEVDARADDFINKFKQQLKLQRLESLLRYRDTLKAK